MPSTLLFGGLVASAFVAVNVGGSSTGVAFGPATGSDAVSPRAAAALMTAFVFAGGLTLGPRVTETLGAEFVPASVLSLPLAVVVLAVTGVGILLGNLLGVSVSTSGTAVGAVVGVGVAVGTVKWATVGAVVGWWLLAAVAAFWLAALVGRYGYDRVEAALERRASARTRRYALVAGGCGMAYAAGGSNVANAAGALVGADAVDMTPAVLLACAGIGVGAVVFGRRTMATVGEGITDLPVEAALVVQAIAASLITALNVLSIPASLAVTTTMSVVGLGWGRASRAVDDSSPPLSGADRNAAPADDRTTAVGDLYDRDVTKRVVTAWVASPAVAGVLAFVAVVAPVGGVPA